MSNEFYLQYIYPYKGIIIKICRAYTNTQEDFEDYYQEVSLQIWRSKNKFKNQSEWSTWVYRLSLNVCMTLLKKKKHNSTVFASGSLPNQAHTDINDTVFNDEDLNRLYEAIKRLSEVDRAVIVLYLEEKSYAEIASILGTNSNNIGVRIKRIKIRLKKILSSKHYE